uniref:Cathepsin L1-like n=1 Tax=Callorhinchus milii TaxID=7868 RepID=A0A4W3K3C9_CALMI
PSTRVEMKRSQRQVSPHVDLSKSDSNMRLWTSRYINTEIIRRTIWWENNKKIEAHNAKHRDSNHTFKMAMNHFGDWVSDGIIVIDKIHKICLLQYMLWISQAGDRLSKMIGALPQGICWTSAGYVTEVKYQGPCSSCWAFSVTGSLEGQLFKKTGKLISLSEQNLVDCSRGYGSNGCNGGWPSQAYQYIKDNRGIEATATYPYIEHSTCNYDGSNKVTSISGFKVLPFGNEAALAKAVAEIGPIAVVIDASLASFQFYSSGVYYDVECKSNKYNHAVLVVGYGVQGGQNYWNVKNSWGVFWGNNGYIRMAKDRNNHCAIASYPMYPEI